MKDQLKGRKIILICTQLEAGGAQRASFKLSHELNKRNIECINCFLYKKRSSFEGLGLQKNMLERPIKSVFDYLLISIRLYKFLKKEKPYAVITFTHYANVLGLFISFIAGIKIRVASHRNPSWGDMSKVLIKIDCLLANKNIYTSITAVSKSTKESFDYYPEQIYNGITVINNGLSLSPSEIDKPNARQKFGMPANVKIIGTIGRLSRQKNHQLLIRAISKLEDVYLVIVGDGELKVEIISLINSLQLNNRVILLGEIKYDLIPLFLKSIDLFVMPSLFEGLSNALVEAMAAGVPVITSDVDSQRDVVISEDGTVNGILLDPEDTNLWVSEINNLLNDEELLNHYKNRSLIRSKDFTIEKMANGFLDVINNN